MNTLFGLRKNRKLTALTAVAGAAFVGVSALGATAAHAAPASVAPVKAAHTSHTAQAAQAPEMEQTLFSGSTKGSYFWDDASGRQGDTGMPAIGKPMQKGLFSSPSWPLGTEGYVMYKGKKAKFFIGDRGPGVPSESGVMIDIDGKTFAELTGGTWNTNTLTVENNGGEGHIKIDYVVTKWGSGPGTKGAPQPFSSGAWRG
ncbi:hypothetical protein [Microtetraspora fusca]|uniref:Uncharacterized protein n=1 Tax=Microtetraspora fusca TaxID=1997 RepID=A0ABW6V5Y7_MICFU|nr:hypothetical protein [Microtetraspora fusca]